MACIADAGQERFTLHRAENTLAVGTAMIYPTKAGMNHALDVLAILAIA